LTDRTKGKLIAVVGMDIDARSWGWDIAYRASLPAGLLLALFILAGSRFPPFPVLSLKPCISISNLMIYSPIKMNL
jgi:hypothetical protein